MRIYVGIGEEIAGAKELRKVELDRLVQRSIIRLGPVTMGQLGSENLLRSFKEGREIIHLDELADELASKVQILNNSGLRLDDRLVAKPSFDKRLHDFVGYCCSKHILKKSAPGIFIIERDKVLNINGLKHGENPIQYSSNELKSLQELFPIF